jgi:hypothetical protein
VTTDDEPVEAPEPCGDLIPGVPATHMCRRPKGHDGGHAYAWKMAPASGVFDR